METDVNRRDIDLGLISIQALKNAYHAEIKQLFGHLSSTQRLERAYDMLVRDDQYSFAVTGQSPLRIAVTGPNGVYEVIPRQQFCSCPDLELLCKHRLAVKLLLSAATRLYSLYLKGGKMKSGMVG